MAQSNNKTPYKNNTLSWIAGNFAEQSKSDWQQAWQELTNVVWPRLKNFWSNFLNAEKQIFVDNPINAANAVGNFMFGSAERNTPQWKVMPRALTAAQYQWEAEVEEPSGVIQENVQENVQETPVAQNTPVSTWATRANVNNVQWQSNWSRFKNANVNFEQYWDDSSPDKQYQAWGMNEKYTWEWVKTSNLAYDPNITTSDLDPNYLYWMDAQYANSDNAWYIARRNDMIASALYNEAIAEWRNPTKEDVINFLASQKNWNNSTEADRFNTVESVWKRLGGIAWENQINETTQAEVNDSQSTYSDPALNNMQNDLNKSTAWELYGKVTADKNTSIETLEDDNSVYKSMNESRIQSFKQIDSMESSAIAAAVISNSIANDSQSMRDLMQYDPAKYQEVQEQIKQLKWQMTINSITNWDTYPTFNNGNAVTNDISDFAASNSNSSTSTADILKNVNSTLSSNDAASTASETMASIESDIAVLQNRLKNLKKEANTVFKWDVPQYIVNAYISNRTAEIQDQMSILENRYNAAQSRYQQEWEKTKWEAEFDLKKQELQLKKESASLTDWSTRQGIALKWAELNWTTNWVTPLTTLSVQESMNILSDFSSSYANNSYGWQCGTFVKRYLSQLWINLPNVSSIDSKKSLIDSSIADANQWDIVIMDSAKYPENWHMAIVESVDDDGTLHLLESNWNNDELVHRRTISPNDSKILWYYRPTWWTTATWQQWGNFQRRDWEVFNVDNAPTYNSLSYDKQNIVKWLLNLSVNPSTITKRNYWDDFELILSAVHEINPSWTEWDFWQADKTKKEWNTSTKNGSNSRNGTAIATAKELYEMSDLLWNTKFTDWNDMVNTFKKKMSNEDFIRFRVKLWTLASEYAWALKGNNAAPTEKEIEEARQQIAENLSAWGIRAAAIEMTKSLYNKNANEADNYKNVTLEKPNLIVTKDVADWMYDVAWITTLPNYYNYMPSSWRAVVANSNNNLSNQDMVNNIFSL